MGFQILSGIFPIAQVREPYSAVGYLAQRLDLPRLLHLSHPDMAGQPPAAHSQELPWSAYDICEGGPSLRLLCVCVCVCNCVCVCVLDCVCVIVCVCVCV